MKRIIMTLLLATSFSAFSAETPNFSPENLREKLRTEPAKPSMVDFDRVEQWNLEEMKKGIVEVLKGIKDLNYHPGMENEIINLFIDDLLNPEKGGQFHLENKTDKISILTRYQHQFFGVWEIRKTFHLRRSVQHLASFLSMEIQEDSIDSEGYSISNVRNHRIKKFDNMPNVQFVGMYSHKEKEGFEAGNLTWIILSDSIGSKLFGQFVGLLSPDICQQEPGDNGEWAPLYPLPILYPLVDAQSGTIKKVQLHGDSLYYISEEFGDKAHLIKVSLPRKKDDFLKSSDFDKKIIFPQNNHEIIDYDIKNGYSILRYRDGARTQTKIFSDVFNEELHIIANIENLGKIYWASENLPISMCYVKSSSTQPFQPFTYENGKETAVPTSSKENETEETLEDFSPSFTEMVSNNDGVLFPVHAYFPHGSSSENRKPAILFLHGGPWEHVPTDQFFGLLQYFVNHGYAAFIPEYAGSTGYGRSHRLRLNGDPEECLKDIRKTYHVLAQHPWIDHQQVYLAGHSFGAFLSLKVLEDPEMGGKFKAGALSSGVYDFRSQFETVPTPLLSRFVPYVGNKDTLMKNDAWCPINSINNISTRFLLIHGTKDALANFDQSKRLSAVATEANKDHKFIIIEGGNHFHQVMSGEEGFLPQIDHHVGRIAKEVLDFFGEGKVQLRSDLINLQTTG